MLSANVVNIQTSTRINTDLFSTFCVFIHLQGEIDNSLWTWSKNYASRVIENPGLWSGQIEDIV